MKIPSLLRKAVSWAARSTARLAVRLHPHLELRANIVKYSFEEDGLATMQNSDFTKETSFQRAYVLGKATGSWRNHELRWRLHVLCWSASWASRLPGNFVECGVYRGGFARAIIDYTDFGSLNKCYHLFDTFDGFPEGQLSESEQCSIAGNYCYEECFADVQREFSGMPFVKLFRGSVPDSLVDVGPVAFLSIDMNCAAPEIAAAKFFWPRLCPGAVIVLDDYGFALHHQQKQAFDELAKSWGVKILSLPTGQGLILKPGALV